MPPISRRYAPPLALLGYALFVVWLTWPTLANLGTAIPGNEGDALVHLWTYDWVKDAVGSGHTLFFTQRLFYPAGVALYTHNFAWLNIALWLPLQALFGGPAAYTLVYLLVLVFNGAATYFLARDLTSYEPAAILSGFIVSGWPYLITRFSQPNLIFIAFVPLALLAMHRLVQGGRWLDGVWLGLAVAGIGLSRYQMLIMAAPLLLLAALYWLWQKAPGERQRLFLQLLLAAGLAALILLPFAAPVLRFQAEREFAQDILRNEAEWGEADLLGYFLPGSGAPLIGGLATRQFPGLLTRTPIGLVTLALLLASLFSRRQDKWLWVGMALLLLLLALGRVLTINGQPRYPLPYAWLEDNLFIVQLVRYPSRFSALLAIPVAVLAGYGLERLTVRLSRRAAWGATAILALFIALAYRPADYPLLDLETPAWYESLATEPGQFGLATIPLNRTFDEFGMSYQLTHNKALVGGHVSRPPREAYSFMNETPFLNGQRERTPEPPASGDLSGQLRPLAANNLPYLVIHKRFLSPDQVTAWRRWLGIAPYHEDAELLVYPTALVAGEDFQFRETAVPGLGFVAGALAEASIGIGDPLTAASQWALAPGAPRQGEACYSVVDGAGDDVTSLCQPFTFAPADGTVQLAALQSTLALPQTPPPGAYQVILRLTTPDGEESEPFELGPLYVAGGERVFDAPKPKSPLAVTLGETLALVGYDGPRAGEQSIDLTLFWQALQETDISYKVYVHLFDAESGELAAQVDTVPRDWSYPTNAWDEGEYVSDRLSLPVGGLPPGRYLLEAGAYHPDTGERLTAVDGNGEAYSNNSIPLGEVILE